MWGVSLLWCGVCGWMFYESAFAGGNLIFTLVTGAFVLIGLTMLWQVARATLEYIKFGGVRLTLRQQPTVGRKVLAHIDLPEKAAAAGHIEAELACIRVRYSRGSKGGTSARSEDEWSEKHRIPIQRTEVGGTAFMHIDVPEALFATDVPGSSGADIDFNRAYYRWELRILGDVRGLDLRRTFDVCVLPARPEASGARADDGRRRPAGRGVAGVNPVVAVRAGTDGAGIWSLLGVLIVAGLAAAYFFEGGRLFDRTTVETPAIQPVQTSHQAERPSREPGAEEEEAKAEVQPEADSFQALPDKDVIVRIKGGFKAMMAGRNEEALRLYGEALSMAERSYGASSLLAAVVNYQISEVHQQQKNYVEQERALQRALAILEQYSIAELRRSPELGNDGIDVAQVAADLGYIYWEWRRYAEAYSWYERAHQAGRDSAASEWLRNRRLAVSSAGLMASACMLGKWDVADRAMAELKQRMERVDDRLKSWLDYWVRTGEPRLAARKC